MSTPAEATFSSRPLSVELAELRASVADRAVTLREVISALRGRAYELLMILFSLPFVAPVSLPGTSTPLGLAIAVISVQLAFGRLPWLPRWLLDKKLPAGFFTKVLAATVGVVRFLEKFLRPRALLLTSGRGWFAAHLFFAMLAALILALPIPFPMTNMFPAWTVLLLAAGLVERDGVFVVGGYVMFVLTLVYFAIVGSAAGGAAFVLHGWLGK